MLDATIRHWRVHNNNIFPYHKHYVLYYAARMCEISRAHEVCTTTIRPYFKGKTAIAARFSFEVWHCFSFEVWPASSLYKFTCNVVYQLLYMVLSYLCLPESPKTWFCHLYTEVAIHTIPNFSKHQL